MPIQMGDLKLYPVEELATLLNIQESTVRKILREGRIPGRKLAKRWYVSEDSLQAYFRQPEPSRDASD
jgi:excisionase family DNA binding protein